MALSSQKSGPIQSNNIVSSGKVVANEVYCQSIHTSGLETNELYCKGIAMIDNLIISNDGAITGGLQANGNFLLKATTDIQDWTINPILNFDPKVLVGNKVGQLCHLFISLTNNTGGSINISTPIFTSIPHQFQPGTLVVCPAILSATSACPYEMIAPVSIVFDTHTKQVFVTSPVPWQDGVTLIGSINYFRTLND